MKNISLLTGLLSLLPIASSVAQAQIQTILTADRTALGSRGSAMIMASFSGTNQAIPQYTMSLSPNVGTLTTIYPGRFYYRAPSHVASSTTVQVRLTFAGSSLPAARLYLQLSPLGNILPPLPTLSLSSSSTSVNAGASLAFTALQDGLQTTSVTWRIQPQLGSISSSGVYTAPGTLSVQTPVTVTATLASMTNVTASRLIQVLPSAATPPPPPPPATPTLSLTPGSANVNAGATAAFVALANGVPTGAVTWQILPQVGSISAGGLYTAPTNLASVTSVQVIARLNSNTSVMATAMMQVQPPAPTLTLTPTSAIVLPGASTTFEAKANGATTTAVAWQLSPQVGSISTNGVYVAPRSIASDTSVQVVARLNSNSNVVATATVRVQQAVPTLSITPSTTAILPGTTTTFTALSANVPTTAVTWQISPQVGSISATGVYTAPASIASTTSVQVTARLNSNTNVSANATVQVQLPIGISLTPPSVSVQAANQTTLTATVTGTTNTGVTWSLNPNLGTISNGVYTAPSSVTQNTAVTVTARSVADQNRSASSTITVTPGAPPPTQSGLVMPVEVYGPNGFVVAKQFNLDAGQVSAAQRLYLQVHGLNFAGEASVQLNNGAWVALNDTNYQLYTLDRAYGGIGGGFATVRGTLALQAGWLVAGQNTIRFRFNQTDGFTNGYRVLAFNLRNGANGDILPASMFSQDDPSTWTAPLPDATSISAGRNLWFNAALTTPSGNINARCAECHAQDGRDLKYFNYSNDVIRSRAVFHGLSDTQGNQIASYIRSLQTPAPGRPWNPPYQPGPGLDSKPVSQWAAGAGLEAVLDRDRDGLSYIFPNGFEPSRIMPSANLSAREAPIAMQMPDWNSWLPQIHPKDAFPGFENSEGYRTYLRLRTMLSPANTSSYLSTSDFYGMYATHHRNFVQTFNPRSGSWPEQTVRRMYSGQLWQMVKEWEVAQEFQTEGMNRAWFGAQGEERGWNNQIPFFASPNMVQVPAGNIGLKNGSQDTHRYLSFIWYHMQLILNNSNKKQDGNSPIDWPYVQGFIMNLAASAPQATMTSIWVAKGMQVQETGIGPEIEGRGWSRRITGGLFMAHEGTWKAYSDLSPSERSSLAQVFFRQWLQKARSFTPQQWYGWQTSPTHVPNLGSPHPPAYDGNMPSQTHFLLQTYKSWGVDATLLREGADWAQSVWPNYAWRANLGL